MCNFIKKPCQHCPYRSDVKPFLTPERGEELAYLVQNPYNTFTCHKTLEDDGEGDLYSGEKSKICAGFLTLMANENGETPYDDEGFVPSYNVYNDCYEMADAYAEANE